MADESVAAPGPAGSSEGDGTEEDGQAAGGGFVFTDEELAWGRKVAKAGRKPLPPKPASRRKATRTKSRR